jgi:FMN phosphatase YigB (HAD superfamily)
MGKVYKNIIFDLGGVILNLDYLKTQQAFEALGLSDFKLRYSQAQQTGLFDQYEQGLCSTPYFINSLLPFLPTNTTANKVVQAWNAMILDFPIEKLDGILALKETHRTFLLSNTNDLHIQAVNRALKSICSANDLTSFFEN